jgi:hypothetical protein
MIYTARKRTGRQPLGIDGSDAILRWLREVNAGGVRLTLA